MNILITSLHYAPEETGNAPYVTGLAEDLVDRGHNVSVLTGFPSYPAWRVQKGYQGESHRREMINGVDVHRQWHYVPHTPSALLRGIAEGSFAASAFSFRSLPRPDAIIGVSPSLSGAVLARLASAYYGAPYVLILQDLIAPAALQSGVRGGRFVSHAIRSAERWAVDRATAVGIVAEGFRPYVESIGVDADRIQRLRNWTHVEPPTQSWFAARERLDLPREAIVCLHAGNMGKKQGLENVIECARLAASEAPGLLFLLMGDGNQRSNLERLAARYRLSNVRLLPLQPHKDFASVLAAADVLLVNQRKSVEEMSLPSKLTSYFAAGRPVVAAASETSETAREVDQSRAGIVVAPENPAALLDALTTLAHDGERCAALGAAGRSWAATMLSKERAMESYQQFLASILAHGEATKDTSHQAVSHAALPVESSVSFEGESDGSDELLGKQVRSGYRRRRLSWPARRTGVDEEERQQRPRAA